MSLKPVSGFYELTVSAVPVKGSSKFVGNTGVKIAVKVLTKISVQNAEIKVKLYIEECTKLIKFVNFSYQC